MEKVLREIAGLESPLLASSLSAAECSAGTVEKNGGEKSVIITIEFVIKLKTSEMY